MNFLPKVLAVALAVLVAPVESLMGVPFIPFRATPFEKQLKAAVAAQVLVGRSFSGWDSLSQQTSSTVTHELREYVLDIGAGDGAVAEYLAQNPNRIVIALEPGEDYGKAHSRLKDLPNITLLPSKASEWDHSPYIDKLSAAYLIFPVLDGAELMSVAPKVFAALRSGASWMIVKYVLPAQQQERDLAIRESMEWLLSRSGFEFEHRIVPIDNMPETIKRSRYYQIALLAKGDTNLFQMLSQIYDPRHFEVLIAKKPASLSITPSRVAASA